MAELVITLHLLTYIQLITFGTLLTASGLINTRRGVLMTPGFRALMYATAITGLVQSLWGVTLFVGFNCRPNNILHLVYGAIGALGIPIASAYTKEEIERNDLLVLTFVAFAIVAAAFRAYSTGEGGVCLPR